jgi:DNA-binding LytR/AlgR family response regulator
MTLLRVMTVDDEPRALRRLEILLDRIGDVTLVASARSGEEAIAVVRRERPDVLLLDIEMPGLTGLDLLGELATEELPVVIFVTAFDRYAVKAFDVSALDYVLKPVRLDRLRAALDKAREALRSRGTEAQVKRLRAAIAALAEEAEPLAPPPPRFEQDLWVQNRSEVMRVPVASVDWIEAEDDYVRLHVGANSYLHNDTMNALEERLDPADFIRIHRSAMIRIGRITGYCRNGYGGLAVKLDGGRELRVGRSYLGAVRRRLAESRSPCLEQG